MSDSKSRQLELTMELDGWLMMSEKEREDEREEVGCVRRSTEEQRWKKMRSQRGRNIRDGGEWLWRGLLKRKGRIIGDRVPSCGRNVE